MTISEGFQLPLELDYSHRPEQPPEIVSATYEILTDGTESTETGISRFTRVVNEEIVVVHPHEAADHLINRVYTPFEAFDQEEIWVCAV